MLKKGVGRVKPWQRAAGSGAGRAKHPPTPTPDLHRLHPPPTHHHHPPPHIYGYPVLPPYQHHPLHPHPHSHPHAPPTPPHHHNDSPPHHKDHHSKDHHHHDHKGHKDHHHGPHGSHSPPPPPGYFKRFFQYIFGSLKKRPIMYTLLFGSSASFAHRKLQPDAHDKHMGDFLTTLKKKSISLDSRGTHEKMKITKLNDSLQNYSTSFQKASSGTEVANAFESLQAASLLKNMKKLEQSLSEEKKQEIARLSKSFHEDNEKLTQALGSAASQLRHCQLMGIVSARSSNGSVTRSNSEASEAEDATREQSHNTDIVMRDQANKTLQAKFSDLTAQKFALETQFIQLVCELLDDSQKEILCNELLANKASSVSQLLKTPVLYPEIDGLVSTKRAVYVLKFDGNLTASGVSTLRHEVTAIVENADKKRGDRVVVLLDSGGGTVGGYGLGASQLERIKAAGLHLTVCVDEVAASGGYLMACVADEIVSAPFATLGSIGVMTMIPNFHERLKREGIHVDTVTAGAYKRTLTPTSKPTPENRKKLQEDLNQVHETFKSHISKYRPEVDIERVATGETWLASDALTLGRHYIFRLYIRVPYQIVGVLWLINVSCFVFQACAIRYLLAMTSYFSFQKLKELKFLR